jgi:cell division protein FtsB
MSVSIPTSTAVENVLLAQLIDKNRLIEQLAAKRDQLQAENDRLKAAAQPPKEEKEGTTP